MGKLVAISTGTQSVTMSPGEIECSVLNMAFVTLCNKYGAEAIIVPPQDLSVDFTNASFDRLIITGGGDINPKRYGQDLNDKTERVSDERDQTELNLLQLAEDNFIKTLAICRGHQLLNVYKGGSLHQDISERFETDIEHLQINEAASKHIHNVNILEDTTLNKVSEKNLVAVNSIHHQVVNELGENLKINAISADNLIEGIEGTTDWEVIGIQWHPENLLDDEITNDLMKWLLN